MNIETFDTQVLIVLTSLNEYVVRIKCVVIASSDQINSHLNGLERSTDRSVLSVVVSAIDINVNLSCWL